MGGERRGRKGIISASGVFDRPCCFATTAVYAASAFIRREVTIRNSLSSLLDKMESIMHQEETYIMSDSTRFKEKRSLLYLPTRT